MPKLKPPVNKNDHAQGSADAPVTLTEYGDFQCPHCGAAHPMIKKIQQSFGKKLKFVFRHFPLSNVHEYAQIAAVAAEAAGRQNKFWEMHDIIFEHQSDLGDDIWPVFAQKLKLKIPAFEKDMDDPALSEKVESDFESGIRSGVNGTPSFYINGDKYNGDYDFESLSEAISKSANVKM